MEKQTHMAGKTWDKFLTCQNNDKLKTYPTNLWQGVRWLWSGILFPGAAAAPERLNWRYLCLLLILPAFVLYPCMSFHLFEPDEGRYAQIPREMFIQGEWLVPHLQGEPYLDKPPLMYWLVMLCYSVFGVHDWSARLVPALSVHGCILLVFLFGRRWVGERAAFWGALCLALAHGFEGMGRLLVLDGLLTFLTTLALFSAFAAVRADSWDKFSTCQNDDDKLKTCQNKDDKLKTCPTLSWRWWLIAAVACGLGILTKGPVILLLVLLPLWLHRRLTAAPPIPWRARLAFAGVAAAIALPWYAAICWRLPEFAHYFLWQHNLMRFLDPFDHIQPVWYYVPILFFCLLPGSLLLWPFCRFLLSSQPEEVRQRSPELGFCLLAGVWCVLFFSLSGSKLPTYILPAFPPLSLALGICLVAMRWQASRLTASVAVVFYLAMIAGNYWIVPEYARYRSPVKDAQQVWSYCGNPHVPVVCFPRNIDSVAFYMDRQDFRSFRSKEIQQLLQYLQQHPRTIVLFSHRHSSESLRNQLPSNRIMRDRVPLGLCDMAIIEEVGNRDGTFSEVSFQPLQR